MLRWFHVEPTGADPCAYIPGLYTASEITDLILLDGYIPIADGDEMNKIRTGNSETMGGCTIWSGTYTTGQDKKYVVVKAIDFSFSSISNWNPLTIFSGIFDGNELPILNFYSTTNGILGSVNTVFQMLNIRISGILDTNGNEKGLLAGQSLQNSATFVNCFASGEINGTGTSRGGFIGTNRSQISKCKFTGNVYGSVGVGGFVGQNNGGGIIEDCGSYSYVEFNGIIAFGGIFVGRQQTVTSVIRRCEAIGNIVHNGPNIRARICGGFIGVSNDGSLIENCRALGTATGRSRVGGFAGQLSGSNHTNCYCAVAVSGDGTFVGGYSNRIEAGVQNIIDCYFDADVAVISATLAASPRTTIQMQEGTEDSYILPAGGIDGSSNPANLMYENWDSAIWNFGTSTDYPLLINTP